MPNRDLLQTLSYCGSFMYDINRWSYSEFFPHKLDNCHNIWSIFACSCDATSAGHSAYFSIVQWWWNDRSNAGLKWRPHWEKCALPRLYCRIGTFWIGNKHAQNTWCQPTSTSILAVQSTTGNDFVWWVLSAGTTYALLISKPIFKIRRLRWN